MIGSDGGVYNKDQFVAEEKKTKYTKVTVEGVTVHAYGSTAIATYLLTVKGTGSDGKPMDLRMNSTDTWVTMPNGKWQCVASIATRLKK